MTNNVVNTGSIRFHTPRSSKIYCSERGWLIWHRASVLDSGANLSPSMVVAIAVSANATAIGIFVWGSCGSVFRRLLPPPPPFSSPTCPHTTCTHTQLVITHLFTTFSHTLCHTQLCSHTPLVLTNLASYNLCFEVKVPHGAYVLSFARMPTNLLHYGS